MQRERIEKQRKPLALVVTERDKCKDYVLLAKSEAATNTFCVEIERALHFENVHGIGEENRFLRGARIFALKFAGKSMRGHDDAAGATVRKGFESRVKVMV
jgi:hypothetical protein